MSQARISNFVIKIVNDNIIEFMITVIYHFDIINKRNTESYICKDYVDKKNNPGYIKVAVVLIMIWDSHEDVGKWGHRITFIYYTRKVIGNHYT